MPVNAPPPPQISIPHRWEYSYNRKNHFDDALTFDYSQKYKYDAGQLFSLEINPNLIFLENYITKELADLPRNWDGYDALPVSKKVIENTLNLLSRLPEPFINHLDDDVVIPNSNGTISILWEEQDNQQEVFLEIGNTYSTYYFKKKGKILNQNQHLELNNQKAIAKLLDNISEIVA